MTSPPRHPGFGSVLVSEWTKIRTVKSTFWTLLAALVVTVGISVLLALAFATSYDRLPERDRATFDPAAYGLVGINFGIIALGVLGVLVIAAEYSTGMIRTSLTAVPYRSKLLAAKLLVLFALSLLVGMVASFGSFLLSQLVYGGKHLGTSLGHDNVLRAVIGGGLYLAVIAVFALGIGAILRHTAGSITVVVGLFFVLPIFGGFLPGGWGRTVRELLPSYAGGAIMTTHPTSAMLTPWTGFAVFCLYAVVTIAAAFLLFQRRDA